MPIYFNKTINIPQLSFPLLHFFLFRIHRNTASVYQVTRLGHEHCDITEGELLDITPLVVDGKKLVTLYDKDLTEGINLLIGELIMKNFTPLVNEPKELRAATIS